MSEVASEILASAAAAGKKGVSSGDSSVLEQDAHLRWLAAWKRQMLATTAPDDLRPLHRWMWSSWQLDGAAVVVRLNAALGLDGNDLMQRDIPHLFAGNLETVELLFVNINPGWQEQRNPIEDAIVGRSEDASWCFSRSLFTRYPAEVGRMTWWNQAIGLGWRIVNGASPVSLRADQKRSWAIAHLGGWELFPLHSRAAGFLNARRDPTTAEALHLAMQASLCLAVRLARKTTIVASRVGADLANDLARREGWPRVGAAEAAFPAGTKAYQIGGRVLLSIPRQLVSKKHPGVRFDDIASAIRVIVSTARSEPT